MNIIANPINWKELVSKLRQKYPKLTKTDLHCEEGEEQDMLRMVEYKLRKTRKEMEVLIEEL